MCSTAAQRLAEIGQAIDDLAVRAGRTATTNSPRTRPANTEPIGAEPIGTEPIGTDPLVARVAELWAQLVELDPEVARRLVGYQALATPTD